MFTEIKEAANFLARYYLGKIPRRRVGLFLAELGNVLAQRYAEMWDLNEPKLGEEQRVLFIRNNGLLDNTMLSLAQAMMVDLDTLVSNTPNNVMLYINPGEVYYKCGPNSMICPIWVGPVTSDDNYLCLPAHATNPHTAKVSNGSMMGAAGRMAFVGRNPANGVTGVREVEEPWIALHLEEVHPVLLDSPFADAHKQGMKKFAYYPKDHKPFTAEQFSQTRFGSNRVRPDHDALKKIQEQAAVKSGMKNDGAGDFSQMPPATVPVRPSPVSAANAAMQLLQALSREDREAVLRSLTQADGRVPAPSGSVGDEDSKITSSSPPTEENAQFWNNSIW